MGSERGMQQLIYGINFSINYELNNNAQQRRPHYCSETLMTLNAAHELAVAIAHISLSEPEQAPIMSGASSSATAPALT